MLHLEGGRVMAGGRVFSYCFEKKGALFGSGERGEEKAFQALISVLGDGSKIKLSSRQ